MLFNSVKVSVLLKGIVGKTEDIEPNQVVEMDAACWGECRLKLDIGTRGCDDLDAVLLGPCRQASRKFFMLEAISSVLAVLV
jgi:hypothetical protein